MAAVFYFALAYLAFCVLCIPLAIIEYFFF